MFKRSKIFAGMAMATALVLTGCGASNTTSSNGGGGTGGSGGGGTDMSDSPWADCDMREGTGDVAEFAGQDVDQEISIAAFNGWDESWATAHILKAVLVEDGYTVDIKALDAAPAYTAVASGDVDLLTDGWLPITHDDYLTEYGDDMDSLGCWYDNAKLTIAVNEDSPAQSIADLADMADEYNSTIVGIEPGAGLTKQTEEVAIPAYGLDDWSFTTSSTPAMLAAVQNALNNDENIAVTLWRPHWAYDAYPMRDLEDPEGAMGGVEFVYSFATSGFEEEHPYVAQLVKNLVMSDDHLAELENIMFSEENFGGSDHDAAVEQWLNDNPDFVEDLRAGTL